ncbi:multiple sugar transport system substrate-binding protein [Paenibacillus phyllosphaerae]|uniref:Multiple sugar transport system substrate-binding protein n=1 Tax=Paenibacillus phyllosphaerae TaxID=274593 RepID=A0A7W5FRL7_9BACL|nr:extracellular solute-binding protein [Paenibacillus phyllosphaerae]MBB3114447.1 multiple sugar transport system substrate-binding protein [Paenibacillus phyllosphaerae]
MKKRFVTKSTVSVSSLLVMAMLAACSTNNGTNTEQTQSAAQPESTAEKTKISYWSIDRHDMDYMQQQVDSFNATNTDNIEVEMKVMADNYNQAVEVAFASKQAPDIFRSGDFQTFVSKGYYAQLDSLLSQEFLAKFDGLLVEDIYSKDGHVYTLPNSGQFWRLIYNADLMEKAGYAEPPKTLDEMVDAANKITEQGKSAGVYGFASNFKNGSGFTRPAFASGSLSSATSHEGYNYQTGEFDFGMYRDIASAMRQIKEDGSMIPGAESLDIDPLRAQFAQGKIGMYVNHSSEPAVYASQFPTDIRWASALVPTKDGQMNGVTWVNAGGYLGISAQSDKQEAAAKFLEFLYGTELRAEYQEKGLGLSVLPYVSEVAGKPELAGIDGFLPTKYDGMYPVTPLSITDTKLEGKKFTDVFIEYILTGKPDLEEAISDLNARYAKALAAARAEGLTNIEANPSFNAASLQGTLGE